MKKEEAECMFVEEHQTITLQCHAGGAISRVICSPSVASTPHYTCIHLPCCCFILWWNISEKVWNGSSFLLGHLDCTKGWQWSDGAHVCWQAKEGVGNGPPRRGGGRAAVLTTAHTYYLFIAPTCVHVHVCTILKPWGTLVGALKKSGKTFKDSWSSKTPFCYM